MNKDTGKGGKYSENFKNILVKMHIHSEEKTGKILVYLV
jgi:hypothetical protein